MYKRPVMTHVGTASRLVCKKPALVYWIFTEPATINVFGTVTIYDGWDDAGVEKAKIVAGYCRVYPFYPPILCADALYIKKAAEVTSYTVGYLPESVAMRK